jgi:hypothetical protein
MEHNFFFVFLDMTSIFLFLRVEGTIVTPRRRAAARLYAVIE